MFETFVKTVVYALAAYAGLGLVFAVPFVWFGVQQVPAVIKQRKKTAIQAAQGPDAKSWE